MQREREERDQQRRIKESEFFEHLRANQNQENTVTVTQLSSSKPNSNIHHEQEDFSVCTM